MRRRHYVPVLLRLIICPIITVLLLRVIGAASWIPDGHSILLTVYLACITPACATVTSMAQLYDRDAEYSSALSVSYTHLDVYKRQVVDTEEQVRRGRILFHNSAAQRQLAAFLKRCV